MITTLVAFAIPAAISIYEAIAYALAAGAITAGVVESTKRYDEWKTNRRQTEAFTYNRTPPLTPAQLHKKKTLTTQEIVPEYVDVSPHNVVEIKEGNDAPANVSVTVPKHVAKTLPTRSLVLHTQTPSGLVGKVSPLILDAEAIALGARKLYDLSQVPLAKSVDLSTGVTPISAEQLIVSVPTPPDPKDPKGKKGLKKKFTKSGRQQVTADKFLKESAEKLSRVNEPVGKTVARSSKPLYNTITGVSAAHQFLHNVSPVIELMRDYSIPSITDRQFKTYGDAPITVKYFTPDGEEAFEGTYSDPDLRRILLNKEYENMSESDRRALWADIAMHLYHRPEFKIIKGEETMAPHEALDSLSFSPYLENPVHRNYIPIEVIDQSIEDVSNNLIHGAKSNKTNIFTVTPQDYDKIMRSDLPMWRKAVGAVDYGVGQFTKQGDENLSPWGIGDNVTNIFTTNDH